MGFDPATLMLAGTALGAFGEYQAGQDQSAMAEYNAKVQEREAQAAEQKAMIESRRQAAEAARQMSTLRARMGASGVISTTGAPLEIQAEQARQSELENAMIGYEGVTEAQRLRSGAAQTRYAGKVAKQASRIKAGTTLLTGFGQAYGGF